MKQEISNRDLSRRLAIPLAHRNRSLLATTRRGVSFLEKLCDKLSLILTDRVHSSVIFSVPNFEDMGEEKNRAWMVAISLQSESLACVLNLPESLVYALAREEFSSNRVAVRDIDNNPEAAVLGTAYSVLSVLDAFRHVSTDIWKISGVEICSKSGNLERGLLAETLLCCVWNGVEYTFSVSMDESSEHALFKQLPYLSLEKADRVIERLRLVNLRFELGWRCENLLDALQLSPGGRIDLSKVSLLGYSFGPESGGTALFRCSLTSGTATLEARANRVAIRVYIETGEFEP